MAAYVELPGEIVLRQPIALSDAMMYAWPLEADLAHLQALCDQVFNVPSGGAVMYRPLLPVAMLVCAQIGRGQSTDPIDHAKGWMAERDLGFWVPLVRGKLVDGAFHAEALVWYQPYLFIDNEAALVVGRETYGFRKYAANIQFPASPSDRAAYVVETLIIPTFGPNQQGVVRELWRAEAEGARGELASVFGSLRELVEHVVPHLRARFEGRGELTWALIEALIRDMIEGLVPMVFLRQFRDLAHADQAAFQDIVEAPCQLDHFHGAGIARPHQLTIQYADSHPIVRQLGLAGSQIDLGLGLWLHIDFTMANGAPRWSAG